jgi:osmotically inducible protein OsmC
MKKIKLAGDPVIDSTVGIGPIPKGFGIEVEMNISVPGMDKAEAEALVAAAHQVCPYSNATRNNIDVKLNVV